QQVAAEQCGGVEPQAGKYLTAIDAVRSRKQGLVTAVTKDEPAEDLIIRLFYDVLTDAVSAVGVEFWSQVITRAARGNLYDQLWSTLDATVGIALCLSAPGRRNPEVDIRLKLVGRIESDGAAITADDSGSRHA